MLAPRRSAALAAIVLVCSLSVAPVTAQATAQPPVGGNGADPASLLRADHTLDLSNGFNGALDLAGYSVTMDPERGPVFGPAGAGGPADTADATVAPAVPVEPAVAAPAAGSWAGLGSSRRAFKGGILALAKMGTDVYAGGSFSGDDGAFQGIARWDGTSWHKVGSGVPGTVYALAVMGSTLFVGGAFDNAGGVATADGIARWNGTSWADMGDNGLGQGPLNGTVYALAVDGTTLYVGGSFTTLKSGGMTLPGSGYALSWQNDGWTALASNGSGGSSLNNVVYALAVDGSHNVYVGGAFTNAVNSTGVAVTAADYVAKWNGSTWSALGANGGGNGSLNGTVYALLVDGTILYAGGDFTSLAGPVLTDNAAAHLARFDLAGTVWTRVGTGGGTPNLNGAVHAIVKSGTDLYVGGEFSNVANSGTAIPAADGVARWSGSAWSALGAGPGGDGSLVSAPYINLVVQALLPVTVSGTPQVWVGGGFGRVYSGTTRLATQSLVAWTPGTSTWSTPAHVGGSFGSINGQSIYSIVVSRGSVYVGGDFQDVANGDVAMQEADYVARWDGTRWWALGDNGAGNGSLDSLVGDLAADAAGNIYAVGQFTNVNDHGTVLAAADYIARWDGSHWSALGAGTGGNGSLGSSVNTVAVLGTTVFAGGTFTNVQDGANQLPSADYIAAFDTLTGHWAPLLGDGAGEGSLNNAPFTLLPVGTSLYVGGVFYDVNNGGTPLGAADRVARWDTLTQQWSALGSNGAGDGSLGSAVTSLASWNGKIVAGGWFSNVVNPGGTVAAADYLAAWDPATGLWSALGHDGSGDGSIKDTVAGLAVDALGRLYVSGDFTTVSDGVTALPQAAHVARWDGTHWTSLGNDGTGGPAIKDGVGALAVDGATLLAGGRFTEVTQAGAMVTNAVAIAAYGLKSATVFYRSTATQDGWILESGENTSAGGTLSATSTTLRIGDDAQRRQYRSILSFATSSLPDSAAIATVTLRVRSAGITGGGNPVTKLGGFMADVRKGPFGTSTLAKTDFGAAATKTVAPWTQVPVSSWYALDLTAAKAAVNRLTSSGGLTQIRLRFKADDTNNSLAEFLSLSSGNATTALRPQLVVTYLVP